MVNHKRNTTMLTTRELRNILEQINSAPANNNTIVISSVSFKDATFEQLEDISSALHGQKETLTRLAIIGADIGELGKQVNYFDLSEFTELRHLNLTNNALGLLGENIQLLGITSLPNLLTLNLSRNRLGEMKNDDLIDLSSLSTTTIKKPKLQETSTIKLLNCFTASKVKNKICKEDVKKEDKDNVVDADFEDVKEDKEKSA